MQDLYQLYNSMEHNNIMLSFKGTVTSELMTSVLSIMESKMESMEEAPKRKRKVFNVLVECLQNLYHHIDDKDKDTDSDELLARKSAIFMIARSEETYSIMTGNYVGNENIGNLKQRLDKINGMSKDELKAFYKEVLSNSQYSDKGTAGLGMIDIARKSGQKLGYDFEKIDDSNSFFSLIVKIK